MVPDRQIGGSPSACRQGVAEECGVAGVGRARSWKTCPPGLGLRVPPGLSPGGGLPSRLLPSLTSFTNLNHYQGTGLSSQAYLGGPASLELGGLDTDAGRWLRGSSV